MNKYYKLKLNCARTKGNPCIDDIFNCGYISCFPVVKTEESFFGKDLRTVEYSGLGYVIAEKKDDFFEDIILDRKISYNPRGIRNVEDLRFVSDERLLNELNTDITCFAYKEISVIEVVNFINQIKDNKLMIRKYKNELDYVSNKYLIKEELSNRDASFIKIDAALDIINDFMKTRFL